MNSHPCDLDERFTSSDQMHSAHPFPVRRHVPPRMLGKLVRSPRTVSRILVDRFFVPWWLRRLGVEVGKGCSFSGHPLITVVPGAAIRLGDNVRILSREDSNPAGLLHPTILAAVAPGASINMGRRVGISGASIVARAGITIGSNVLIGAGACIWDTDFHPLDPNQRRAHQTRDACSVPINIEDDVFIGARALVLKGVSIGRGAVIGAGAVVTKRVESGQIVAGNPAKVVGAVQPVSAVDQVLRESR